ncbi:putative membrane protein YgcG [Catenulispora sp. GAS73]|uniref:LppU/SCO3897 family protein n=1 Tax=Catenulispora sp. GAS73 TaxID=3156269 RepID=UPI003513BDD6
MTSGTRTVEHADLQLGDRLGRGGQGTVYPVANRKINEAVNGGWEVVYKEYNAATLALLDADALRGMVDLLGDLDADDARWLCDKTAWPVAVVEQAGQVRGFLMRAVPDRFRFSMRSLAGTTSSKTVLTNLEFLLNDEAYIAGIGLAVSPRDRLDLLADLAATLDRLHRMGIAVGDMSPRNLLFRAGKDAGFFLIDCDAMRLHGVSALPQVETPDWQAPAGEEKATGATDVYKFGLVAVRVAAGDQATTDPARLAAMGGGLGDLARSSLDADASQRPATAGQWIGELKAAARTAQVVAPTPTTPTPAAPTAGAGAGAGAPGTPPVYKARKPVGKSIARFGGLVTAAAVVLAIALSNNHGSSAAVTNGSSGSGGGYTSTSSGGDASGGSGADGSSVTGGTTGYVPPPVTTTSDDTGGVTGGVTGSGTTGAYTPQPPPPPPDLIKTLQIGDCVYNSNPSTASSAKLSAAACVPGSFKIVGAYDNTTNMSSCDGAGQVSQTVSSPTDNRVVCLSYQSNGTAYWATPGQCVYGLNGAGNSWNAEACQTGNFKVVARYPQTTDKSRCPAWPQSNESYSYPNSDSGLAVLLCLQMNYPDALGNAQQNECLVKNGNTFTNVDSCPSSNVVVSGRTSTYDDPAFCGHDGSSWWRPSEFPDLGYTVCWRWKQ